MERIIYELQCPCGYHYWVSAFNEPEWEMCPICGLGMEFRLFLCNDNYIEEVFMRTKLVRTILEREIDCALIMINEIEHDIARAETDEERAKLKVERYWMAYDVKLAERWLESCNGGGNGYGAE